MRTDLHNHTIRCNHATGSIDEYIQKAIEIGIDIYGFSEHAPMNFDKKYRLKVDEMDIYEKEILEAKEKYKNEIEILLAYEVDFLSNYMDKRVFERKVDYFIGSIHFINEWGFDNPEFIGKWEKGSIDEIWKSYFNAVKEMAKSGKFDIVGHFDLIKLFKFIPKTPIEKLANEALKAIKKSNMVIEINSAGLRKPINELYPSLNLLKEANSLDIPISFSSDAHSIEQVGAGYKEAIELAKEAGYSKTVTFKQRDRKLITF